LEAKQSSLLVANMPLPCCGEKKSKEQLEEEQYEKDLLKVFNKDQIYLDDKGNFRYGEKKFDPEYELNVIVDNDDQEEEVGRSIDLSSELFVGASVSSMHVMTNHIHSWL